MVRYFSLILFGLFFISCQSRNPVPSIDESLYYPIMLNAQWEYEVNQVEYSISNEPIRSNYIYREIVSEVIDESIGLFKINRDQKADDQSNWTSLPSKLIRVSKANITAIEANGEDILLLFPISLGISWNSLNGKKTAKNTANYINLKEGQLLIENQNDSSAIDLVRKYTVFEINKGPVFYKKREIQYCQESPDCIGKGIIASGKEETYTLTKFTF